MAYPDFFPSIRERRIRLHRFLTRKRVCVAAVKCPIEARLAARCAVLLGTERVVTKHGYVGG